MFNNNNNGTDEKRVRTVKCLDFYLAVLKYGNTADNLLTRLTTASEVKTSTGINNQAYPQ